MILASCLLAMHALSAPTGQEELWGFARRIRQEDLDRKCIAAWSSALSAYARHCSEWSAPIPFRRDYLPDAVVGFAGEIEWALKELRPRIETETSDSATRVTPSVLHVAVAYRLLWFQLTHIGSVEAKLGGARWLRAAIPYGATGPKWDREGRPIEDLPVLEDCGEGALEYGRLEKTEVYVQSLPGARGAAVLFYVKNDVRPGFLEGWWRLVLLPLPATCAVPAS